MKKSYANLENENTNYHDKLSSAQNEINTLKVKKSSEDRKIQKALNLYYDYERQKVGLDTKSLILENSQREAEQERREYEKRKNQFEGKLDEIKKHYNIILKLILIVFVPVVMASMILNIEKSMEILDFMYMITNVPFKRMIGFIKAVADSGDAIDIFLLVSTISFIIIIPILYGWYKLSQIKWHEKGKVISEKFDYKNLDETYFLPAIYFSEFVVIVYVDIFFFIPVNSFGLFLAVAVCTHFIYQAYIRGKLKTPVWKFK